MTKLIILTTMMAMISFCASAYATERGDVAPGFELPALSGDRPSGDRMVALADYAGKVIYIDFWAAWCAPCRDALPLLDRLHRTLVDRDFEVLAVNLDEDPGDGRRFLVTYPVGYTVLSDPTGRVAKRYSLKTMPTSFLVDRSGVVRYVHKGFHAADIEKIRSWILRELEAD